MEQKLSELKETRRTYHERGRMLELLAQPRLIFYPSRLCSVHGD